MKVVNKLLTEIKPYEKNPRINADAVKPVAESIKQFGFKVPIVIDDKGVIIAGHTRYKAAQLLELDEVPCIVADDLTPEKIKAFRLADNKTGELAQWDFALLADELDELTEIDIDMSDFGFVDCLDDEIAPIDDEDLGGTKKDENYLKIGKYKLILTQDEYDGLIAKIEAYVNDNGVSFGFVNAVLLGGVSNAN